MGEVGDAYAGCRARISELVRDLDEAGAATTVPACPDWSVHDLVAHLSGVVDDALNGRLDGVATDPWTKAQVEARRDRSVAEMLGDWDAGAPSFEELLDVIGDAGRQAVADIVTHEHDFRGALAAPGARHSDAVKIGVDFLAPGLIDASETHGHSLRVRSTEGPEWGPSDAPVILSADPFELVRALTGRRSVDQLLAMEWQGDGEAVIPAFTRGPFRPAEVSINE